MMKHPIRNALFGLLLAASGVACGGEAPEEFELGEQGEALELEKVASLKNAKTGGYVSTLKIARNAAAGCGAQSVVISGSGKKIQARSCVGEKCKDAELSSLTFVDDRDGVVATTDLVLGTASPKGDVIPVEVDDLLYLCREDAKEGVCECIPWFPPQQAD